MGQEKRRAFSQSYQMLCSRKEQELKEAAGLWAGTVDFKGAGA